MRKILKRIYSLVPFKAQIFPIIRKAFHPGEKISRHLYFKGIFKVPVKGNVSFLMRHYGYELENDIFWQGLTGNWEKKSIELWMKLSERAMVVMDIGANTGVYSLISQSLNSKAKVIAFEPVERIFHKLEYNIQLNNFAVESVLKAVSDHPGEATFYDTYGKNPYSASLEKFSTSIKYRPVQIGITTIDDTINEKKLERVDLLKIDVEHHEPQVIRGFSTIAKYHPSILIEILSDDVGAQVQQQLESSGAGYLYFDINEENGIKKVESIRKSSGMNYLLCTELVARDLQLI